LLPDAHMPPTIFISAGEASGELYGALLIDALKTQLAAAGQSAQFLGMGGERMQAAGAAGGNQTFERIVRSEDMAVMGLTEVLHHLPRIYREFRRLKQAIRARRPSVAVLIDFPEIHFRLAREFHRLGIPVLYFVSPQLWAWKQHRIKLVRQFVRRMLVIFPFEESYYLDRGVDAEFVGHPLAELPPPSIPRAQFALESGLDPAKTWIALLPGSRPREIRDHLPEMLSAAWTLSGHPRDPANRRSDASAESPVSPAVSPLASRPRRRADQFEFIVPLAPTLSRAQRAAVLQLAEEHRRGLSLRFVNDARAALFHARASVVASGTATVEAALLGNPFVVVYRVSPLTYAIAKRVVKVPHVAMANLIAGRRLVPELIQRDFTAANIVQHIEPLLPDGPARESMMQGLKAIRHVLDHREAGRADKNPGAIDRVAAVTLELLGAAPPAGCAETVTSPN
jgi:lipid-A-disaccharide synthase